MATNNLYLNSPRLDESVSTFIKDREAENRKISIYCNNSIATNVLLTFTDATTSQILFQDTVAADAGAQIVEYDLYAVYSHRVALWCAEYVQVVAQAVSESTRSAASRSLLLHFIEPIWVLFEGGTMNDVTVVGSKLASEDISNTSDTLDNFILAGEQKINFSFGSSDPFIYLNGKLVQKYNQTLAPQDDLLWVEISESSYFNTGKVLVQEKNVFTLPLIAKSLLSNFTTTTTLSFTLSWGTVGGYIGEYTDCRITFTPYSSSNTGTQKVYVNNEVGAARIEMTLDAEPPSLMRLERASSKQLYGDWAAIAEIPESDFNSTHSCAYVDTSLEPGVGYRYRLADLSNIIYCEVDSAGKRPEVITTTESVFLTTFDRQLKIKYGVELSSFNYNSATSISSALGSKYPIYQRNGYEKYRSFSLKGTIAFEGEEDTGFWVGEDQIVFEQNPSLRQITLNDSQSLVSTEIAGTSVTTSYSNPKVKLFNDIYCAILPQDAEEEWAIKQKYFREQVMEYLMRNQRFLLRSFTEGNMIVALSNIQLTPKTQLGRNIYDFSAQVTEVADASDYDNINYAFKQQEMVMYGAS